MRKLILVFSLFSLSSLVSAQQHQRLEYSSFSPLSQNDSARQIGFKAGMVNIGGQAYLGLRLQTEFAVKRFGIGVDVPLLFNANTGEIRTEEYYQGIGALRLIRYLRFGRKKVDPFYIRLGDITGTYMGYGLLVNNYSNAVSFERRKFGVTFDVLVRKTFGLEGFYSDFNPVSFNLLGLRPYVRPLGRTEIPVLQTLEVGVGFVTDRDKKSVKTTGFPEQNYGIVNQGMSAWSVDLGLDVISTSYLRITPYAQYGGLLTPDTLKRSLQNAGINYKPGSGASIGAAARLKILGDVLLLDARIERVWFSDFFIPQFFDIGYEINKDARISQLGSVKGRQGVYGGLNGTVLGSIQLGGSLMLPDNIGIEAPGLVQLHARTTKNIAGGLSAQAYYVKSSLRDIESIFYIDERSQINAVVGYAISKYFVVGVNYRWTFARKENGELQALSMISPYFGLSVPLGKTQNSATSRM